MYTDGLHVMICENESEAIKFTDFLDREGRCWQNGESYKEETYWDDVDEGYVIGYYFNQGVYCVCKCAEVPNHIEKVLFYKDFFWDYETDEDIDTSIIDDFIQSFLT